MNLQQIDFILDNYRRSLSATVQDRLGFFRGIWAIQKVFSDAVTVGSAHVTLPNSTDELSSLYWDGAPVFERCPVQIDPTDLENCVRQIARYVIEQTELDGDTLLQLSSANWSAAIASSELDLAGRRPCAWLEQVAPQLPGSTAGILFSLALRALLEPAQRLISARLEKRLPDEVIEHQKSPVCPVCGSAPVLAYVGTTRASQGNGRQLYCAQCGHMWEFERIRCSHCGEVNPNKLHYLHAGADEAHRLHFCDSCGGYMRTAFVEKNNLVPFIPEVEDVVMVTLDALVQSGALEGRRMLSTGEGTQDRTSAT